MKMTHCGLQLVSQNKTFFSELPVMLRVAVSLVIFSAVAVFAAPQDSSPSVPDQNQVNEDSLGRRCTCSGPSCKCCVDFNLTFVDLGGPGCVNLKYLSKENGMLVNVSYGESQLHGDQIKGSGPDVTCMDLLLDLAQMCAKFTSMSITDEGMRACVGLEPTLLGDPQDIYHLGCFLMGPQGMRTINATSFVKDSPTEAIQQPETGGDKPDPSEEDLISAVNETAEQGIAWFSSLLGLNFGKATPNSNATSTEPSDAPPASTS